MTNPVAARAVDWVYIDYTYICVILENNIVSILHQYWSNIGAILEQHCINSGAVLHQYWRNIAPIYSQYRGYIDY